MRIFTLRIRHVEQKKSEDICVYQNENGDIKYSKEIYTENHISVCLKQEIENWLQIALEFNPKQRGYCKNDPEKSNNQLVIFDNLQRLLKKKIISIFSVFTCEFMSYEIDDFTQITTLQGWIERDIKIAKNEQFLLSHNSFEVKTNELAVQYFDEVCYK